MCVFVGGIEKKASTEWRSLSLNNEKTYSPPHHGRLKFRKRGGVKCADPTCPAPVFTDRALAAALPDEVFALYAEAKQALAEQRINAELERGFEKRLEGMREELGKNGDAQKHRTHIVEKILTLACPRCGQAFLDYNGCVALTCSRAGCGAGFCGFCLEVQRSWVSWCVICCVMASASRDRGHGISLA